MYKFELLSDSYLTTIEFFSLKLRFKKYSLISITTKVTATIENIRLLVTVEIRPKALR